MKSYLTLALLLAAAASSEAADFHEVAQSRYWKLLLHWQKPIVGSEKSEAAGPEFFLSPQGKTDAEAELVADVKAFGDPSHPGIGPIKQHPQCAFPERFRYLKETLNLDVKKIPCPDFDKWKESFNPKSVTLIYAAPYFGSPSSMFGHTFLRIDSKPRPGHTEKNDLLDYGISYEADPGADPGLGFALKGLLGFYHGSFLQQSYYLKINNYVNMESRDLWEYQLDLTSEQISRMLNHIWEMGITYFNYFFFNKNCSYELLTLLEVANPNWSLTSQFGAMTIPGDTIRVLSKNFHAVRQTHARPAIMKIINVRLSKMSDGERENFFELRDDYSKLKGTESIKTLDALLDWDKLKVMKELKAIYDPEHNVDKRLLVARAKAYVRERADAEDVPSELASSTVPPEDGHDSSKISVFAGSENSMGLFGIEYRPVFQDVLDPDEGYLPRSSLILARTRASYTDSEFRLDEFTFAEITNLVPLNRLEPKYSWKINGELFHPEDIGCVNCLGATLSGGVGFGVALLSSPDIFLYSLLKPQAQLSNGFQASYNGIFRAGLSLATGLLTRLNSHSKIILSYEPYYLSGFAGDSLHQYEKLTSEMSYAFLPFETRVSGEFIFSPIQSYARLLLTLGRYF